MNQLISSSHFQFHPHAFPPQAFPRITAPSPSIRPADFVETRQMFTYECSFTNGLSVQAGREYR